MAKNNQQQKEKAKAAASAAVVDETKPTGEETQLQSPEQGSEPTEKEAQLQETQETQEQPEQPEDTQELEQPEEPSEPDEPEVFETGVETVIRTRMLDYVAKMKPGVGQSAKVRAEQQKVLFSIIESSIGTHGATDFISSMDQIRQVVAANLDGAFHDNYLFRELANVEIPTARIKHLEYMFFMIQSIGAPDCKQRLQRIGAPEFIELLSGVRDDEVRSRLQQWLARLAK